MAELPLPPVIRIEPASACNLRCVHCPTGTVKAARGLMSEEVFEATLDSLRGHVPPVRAAVLYHGGEPLLNPRFPAMVRRLKEIGLPYVKTVSNGMLLDARRRAEILDSGLDLLEVSLDGESGAESDAIRVRADAERIAANVLALAAARDAADSPMRIVISTTQFRRSADAPGEAPTPEWLRARFGAIRGVQFKSTWAMRWPEWRPEPEWTVDAEPPAAPPRSCALIDETMTVRADGRVVICCYDLLSRSNLGDVRERSLADIWRGAHADFAADFARGAHPAPCATCVHVTGPRFIAPPADQSAGAKGVRTGTPAAAR